jgi:hypothetical protein
MENQHKTAYSPTTPVQGLYMIVPWLKTEFRLVSCSEHFDGIPGSVDQTRMILVVRSTHGRSAQQEQEMEGKVCTILCTVIWYTLYGCAFKEF